LELTEFTRFRRLALLQAIIKIAELDFLRIVVTNPKRCPDTREEGGEGGLGVVSNESITWGLLAYKFSW